MTMRSIIVALFLTLAAFAQEPPAYYYSPTGPDVKYIYNTQLDSIEAHYMSKAERNTQSGLRKKSISTNFFIGGGIGLAASAATMMYIVHTDKEYQKEQKERQRNDSTIYEPPVDGNPLPFLFIIEAGVTVGCIVAGTIFRITGNKKLRNAEYFKKQLEIYRQQKNSVSLEILPTYNPIRQAFGGNLLLDF